jgi:translation initiation factor 2D
MSSTAPLRSSDRRKLKHRVLQSFPEITAAEDDLVPEGLLSVKFSTHLEEPGVSAALGSE